MFGLSTLYIRLIGIALVVAAVIGVFAYIGHIKSQRDVAVAQVAVLGSKLADQTAAVDALKVAADQRLKLATADLADAKAKAKVVYLKGATIYKTVPSKGTTTCESDRSSTLELVNGVTK